MEHQERITSRFALTLLGYGIATGALLHMLSPPTVTDTNLAATLNELPSGAQGPVVLLVVGLAVALFFAGAGLARMFWNRFITDVFSVRRISYSEALSLLLICSVFFGGRV